MSNEEDIYFYNLVLSLQAGAMHQMGKIANPLTGKIERDLTMAKHSIDMLEMLERKTRGNVTDDEKKVLEHVLFELRLNYVDEVKKDQAQAAGQGQAQENLGGQPTDSGSDTSENQKNSR